VTVDLDTDVGTLGLPVKLDVGNIEQVTGTDNLLGGNAHHTNTSGVAAYLRSPEAHQLFVLLDTLAADSGRGPLKVHNTLDLHRCAAEEVHVGEFVDGDGLALEHTSNVLFVGGPLERGPLDLLLGGNIALNDGRGGQVMRDKRTERLACFDIPDNDVLSILLEGQ
jgi:hypothetical protein